MTKLGTSGIADGVSPVRQATLCSLLLLCVLVAGGWLFGGWLLGRSILIGGVLVNASFWLLQRDALRLMERVAGSDAENFSAVTTEKTRFFLRLLARFVVLGLVLFVLASQVTIDVIGLTVGFVTVMVSVVIIGSGVGTRVLPSKV